VTNQPSPLELTDEQLAAEGEAVAMRIAHSSLPVRDAAVVTSLAARLEAKAWAGQMLRERLNRSAQ
jgi:hypothetical protein